MCKTRVAIVGAGPAGLAAASYLTGLNGLSVHLFESGRSSKARICPVDMAKGCNGCAGSCNVISGIGGCIQPGDSIKLSMFPSGRRLLEKIGSFNASVAQTYAMEFFSVSTSEFVNGSVERFGDLELRHYPIHEMDPATVWHLHQRFNSIVKSVDRYHPRALVSEIKKIGRRFQLFDNRRAGLAGDFDKIIMATGRSGYNTIFEKSAELNISTTCPNISLGLRLELPVQMLVSMFQAHKDFKFSKSYGKQKVKSFCFSSSALRGGRIKYCYYPTQFDFPVTLLDGHANYEGETKNNSASSPRGNLGLLVQLTKDRGSKWLNENFLRFYYEKFGGKPVAQPIRNFMERSNFQDLVNISVKDVVFGRVDSLFSEAHHSVLSAAIRDVIRGIAHNTSYSYDEILEAGACIGPEVEFFWPTADVSKNLQTSEPGLYVVGDALGIAQGNFQAAVSGFVAAQGVTIEEETHRSKLVAAA